MIRGAAGAGPSFSFCLLGIAMRVVLLLLVLVLAASSAFAGTVRLHPQAVVADGVSITLGDVAELDGSDARALSDLVVGRFPAGAGTSSEVQVPMDTVLRHLKAAAVNLSLLTVKGARSCKVMHADAAGAAPLPRAPVAPVAPLMPLAPALTPSTLENAAADLANPPGAPELAAVPTLAQRVTEQLVALTGADAQALAVTLRGDADAAAWLNAPAPAHDVQIVMESRTGLGRVPVRVRRFAQDGTVHETRLTADVAQRVGVVVVTAPIRRGDRFTAQNVALQHIELDRRHGTPVADLDAVLGRSASATLRVGMPVIERHLAPDVLVKRGDLVTVTVNQGRLRIRTVGRATENGERGAIIALRNDATREKFYATVTGPRHASIDSGSSIAR